MLDRSLIHLFLSQACFGRSEKDERTCQGRSQTFRTRGKGHGQVGDECDRKGGGESGEASEYSHDGCFTRGAKRLQNYRCKNVPRISTSLFKKFLLEMWFSVLLSVSVSTTTRAPAVPPLILPPLAIPSRICQTPSPPSSPSSSPPCPPTPL